MQRAVLSFADLIVRSPLVRWTWTGLAEQNFPQTLGEFRPTDPETVNEMVAGRYLLASKLADTDGVSPFSIEPVSVGWQTALHEFAWLRHFRDARNADDRSFARTLTMDWIGRNGKFNDQAWAPRMTAVRVLNWLRHLPMLIDGASEDQAKTIKRSLGTQLQSLRLRGALVSDPMDILFTAIALMGAALCDGSPAKVISARLAQLSVVLTAHLDEDGLHKSRNSAAQLSLLTELATVRQALGQRHSDLVGTFGEVIDRMHTALDMLTLSTGEPAYFNGCGQLPVDLVISVQSQSAAQRDGSAVLGGYGVLVSQRGTVIADGGMVPPPQFGAVGHASALAFEFSHGSDLVVGNCGPAPLDFTGNDAVFRQGVAHSGPTIDGLSSARFLSRGPYVNRLRSFSSDLAVEMNKSETSMRLQTSAYAEKFGVDLVRDLTFVSDGDTLVGQDRMVSAERGPINGRLAVRFHLAPGAEVSRRRDEDIITIELKSGAEWTFLWDGGTASIDDSVRQSAYFGLFRIKQIVIETDVKDDGEISWILTRQTI